MIIVNAVECTKLTTLETLVDSYFRENPNYTIYTDNLKVKNYTDSTYGAGKCVHNESLVALWLRIVNKAILIITDINNVCSEVYTDLSNNYTITVIERSDLFSEDFSEKDKVNIVSKIGGE